MIENLRLIELFAGYGSQALALKYLHIPFEHHFVCEFDKYAIQSYNDIHGTNFEVSDIRNISADDLNIVDTNKFKYLLTYSFPCTDLSVAGRMRGMQRGSNTSSSLLWEVERLLKECKELPQYLLMENVPQVISNDNIKLFGEWTSFLTKLGYTNYYKILDAQDFGVPQHRERCFMISILKSENRQFSFPTPIKLTKSFSENIKEKSVDSIYYLVYVGKNRFYDSEKKLFTQDGNVRLKTYSNEIEKFDVGDIANLEYAQSKLAINSPYKKRVYKKVSPTITTHCYSLATKDSIKSLRAFKLIENREIEIGDFINITYDTNIQRKDDIAPTLTTRSDCLGYYDILGIRKLTPKECFRLMGVKDNDYDKLTISSDMQKFKQAGNSIVVDVLMAIFKNMFIIECKDNRLF